MAKNIEISLDDISNENVKKDIIDITQVVKTLVARVNKSLKRDEKICNATMYLYDTSCSDSVKNYTIYYAFSIDRNIVPCIKDILDYKNCKQVLYLHLKISATNNEKPFYISLTEYFHNTDFVKNSTNKKILLTDDGNILSKLLSFSNIYKLIMLIREEKKKQREYQEIVNGLNSVRPADIEQIKFENSDTSKCNAKMVMLSRKYFAENEVDEEYENLKLGELYDVVDVKVENGSIYYKLKNFHKLWFKAELFKVMK